MNAIKTKSPLKPCPFCGKHPAIFKAGSGYTVACQCGAESPKDGIDEKSAAAHWNNRADRKLVNGLKAAAKLIQGTLDARGYKRHESTCGWAYEVKQEVKVLARLEKLISEVAA